MKGYFHFFLFVSLCLSLKLSAETLRFRLNVRNQNIELKLVSMPASPQMYRAYIQNGYMSWSALGYFLRSSEDPTSFKRTDDGSAFDYRILDHSDLRNPSLLRVIKENGMGYFYAADISKLNFSASGTFIHFSNNTFRLYPFASSFVGCLKSVLAVTK